MFEKKLLKIFKVEQVSWAKVLLSSVAMKLEITVLCDIPRDLGGSHNSLSLPIHSENISSENVWFFLF